MQCRLDSLGSDRPLHPCLRGGCCLCSGLCPRRQTSFSWTAFPMCPRTILITSIAIFGRGTVSPTKTMLHSKVKKKKREWWNDGCFERSLHLSSIHVSAIFVSCCQFLPGTYGQAFLRTMLVCCISGIVVWASAVSLETAGSPTTSQVDLHSPAGCTSAFNAFSMWDESAKAPWLYSTFSSWCTERLLLAFIIVFSQTLVHGARFL